MINFMNTVEITQNIDKAIASHGMWKMRLKKAIETQTSEFEVAFVRSPHNCEFGKWLDKDKPVLSKYSYYNEVFNLHKQLHEETARIMQLALSARKEEATKAIAVGSTFSAISAKLTLTMMNWKKGIAAAA